MGGVLLRPFDEYPGGGRVPLSRPRSGDATCRHGYGLDFQRRTGQTRCAYCGVSLVDDYHHWLLMALDHVVPAVECGHLGVPSELAGDCINLGLACSGCNGFRNRFTISRDMPELVAARAAGWTIESFVALRDAVFELRSRYVTSRRTSEEAFYRGRPWVQRTAAPASTNAQ